MGNRIFKVTDFGAVSESKELQTQRIQSALDQCFLNGGGTVVVPKGVYLSGGLRIRSNCTLYLESGAILKGSRNPEDYFGYLADKIEPLTENEITDKVWKKNRVGCGKGLYISFQTGQPLEQRPYKSRKCRKTLLL